MPPLATLRRRDVVPHCNDVNVRVGRHHIILAKMSHMQSENRLSVCCHLQGANAPIASPRSCENLNTPLICESMGLMIEIPQVHLVVVVVVTGS
jgi:hypothetical protein